MLNPYNTNNPLTTLKIPNNNEYGHSVTDLSITSRKDQLDYSPKLWDNETCLEQQLCNLFLTSPIRHKYITHPYNVMQKS